MTLRWNDQMPWFVKTVPIEAFVLVSSLTLRSALVWMIKYMIILL